MGGLNNPGVNRLANALQERMNRNREADSALVLDFGVIQGDYSLKTNTFGPSIPQSDYTVCRQLTLGPTGAWLTETHVEMDGSHTHPVPTGGGAHDHDIKIPEKMRSIKPGDRVLVAWVQSEAVVVDIILPGTAV